MRGRRLRTLLFYAVLCYFLYRYFTAEEAQPIPINEQQQPSDVIADQTTSDGDRNIILRVIFFVASIIPWIFSWIWTVLGFSWSIIVFLWGIISYVWTLFMLVVNGVYVAMAMHLNRHRVKSQYFFLQLAVVFLILPTAVNWLLIRHEIAFNLLLPIYLTIFVWFNGEIGQFKTVPRNLLFFVVICAVL